MRVGCPRERKPGEGRVAVTPEGVRELVRAGHEVVIEAGAGEEAGFGDEAYRDAGARLAPSEGVWDADLVVKVKEPVPEEYGFLRPGSLLFAYLHLAANRDLAVALVQRSVTAYAYELVRGPDGSLPLLAPMSQIAGQMAAEVAAALLKRPGPGRGKLLGGAGGVPPARCVVVGSGSVGMMAVRRLVGLGGSVTLLSDDLPRLRSVHESFGGAVRTRVATRTALADEIAGADVLILAVHVPGRAAPKVVSREMVRSMGPGAVLIDVAIDQGGAAETSRPTTLTEPTFVEEGVVHYCVTNMPGAVPRTSTQALVAATLPYVLRLAALGARAREDPELGPALVTEAGRIVHPDVAAALGTDSP